MSDVTEAMNGTHAANCTVTDNAAGVANAAEATSAANVANADKAPNAANAAEVPGARNPADAARATLDAWRERGTDRHDPVRFRFIDALERRASAHSGEVRRLLDERLANLLQAYAKNLERVSADATCAEAANEPTHATLQSLVDYLATQDDAPAEIGLPDATTYPELPALDYFRDVWSKVRTEKQMRQSLEQVPGNAGPLNSSSLVHRALSLMREVSPEYLKQFLSYVDALSWMEQINGGAAPTGKDAPRAGNAGKTARGKARSQ